MTAGSELDLHGLWWYVLAGVGKYHTLRSPSQIMCTCLLQAKYVQPAKYIQLAKYVQNYAKYLQLLCYKSSALHLPT